MGKQQELRASGKTAADEAAATEVKDLDVPTQEAPSSLHDGLGLGLNGGAVTRSEDKGMSLTPSFSRMRTDWNGPDREVISDMHKGVEAIIGNLFHGVYAIIYSIDRIVRIAVRDPVTGEVKTDAHGLTVWQVDPDTGQFMEDWQRMGSREREDFIYKLTTGLVRWEQTRDRLWAEALFARAKFEEGYANGYRERPNESLTIDDRTAQGRSLAADLRYFSVYASYLSKRADSMVRSAERLNQRLKDLSL